MNLKMPTEVARILQPFAAIFTKPVWARAQILLVGAILTTGNRTITSVLAVMGLSDEKHFQNYHRVLNRAVWSSLEASKVLLMILVTIFVPSEPIIMGIDDTIERRKGRKITAKGIYRDPVRSSHTHFHKVSGLRWLSIMLLVEIPWANRVWALPFMTTLAPSERYSQQHKSRHKKLTDWARQMLLQIRRWLPGRQLVVVADSSFAALELLDAVQRRSSPIHLITRLRLDAALYQPAPPRLPKTMGRPRIKGERLPNLAQVLIDPETKWESIVVNHWYGHKQCRVEIFTGLAVWYHTGLPPVPIRFCLVRDPHGKFQPQALLSTNQDYQPQQILEWFVRRWQVEVTFQEVRAHLGVETQRQWSDLAIARTTPMLLGLFSVVTILAHHLQSTFGWKVRQTIWYSKSFPTFSDALALVRRYCWAGTFATSPDSAQMVKVPLALFERLRDLAVYAA